MELTYHSFKRGVEEGEGAEATGCSSFPLCPQQFKQPPGEVNNLGSGEEGIVWVPSMSLDSYKDLPGGKSCFREP